jgi:hypothetical protein
MPAMLQHHLLLSWRRQQSKPRHARKVAAATDTNGNGKTVQVRTSFFAPTNAALFSRRSPDGRRDVRSIDRAATARA